MKFNFMQEVLVLPASVLSYTDASAEAIRVLLWLASDLSLVSKPAQLAKLADCDAATAKAAIEYWCEKGVLSRDGAAVAVMSQSIESKSVETPKKKLLKRADELPNYTSVELAELLEKRESVRALVDEAQQILGKIFNMSEVNILVGMLDYLGMSEECVLLLLAHCKRIGKVNLRAIEKYAYTLVDRDITEPTALEEEFRTVEALHSFEGEVRKLFGMKSRALTTRENKMLRAWVSYGYGIEIVRRAYELTISATNEPSVAYANAIIERWHAEGLRTEQEIEAAMKEPHGKKEGRAAGKKGWAPTLGNSFDTDDFFEAALQRSFRETSASNETDEPNGDSSERK